MQTKSLKEISEILAGYTFRGALKSESQGKIKVILAKNIADDGTINYPELIKITQAPPRTNAYVKNKDILLSSRGVFRAGVFNAEDSNIIAASSTFILRVENKEIMPEFIAIYLNSEAGQSDIQKILTGSTIKTILRRSLENLKIPVPTLAVQKQIIDINQNIQKREKLLNQKINLSKNIAEGAIKKLLTT